VGLGCAVAPCLGVGPRTLARPTALNNRAFVPGWDLVAQNLVPRSYGVPAPHTSASQHEWGGGSVVQLPPDVILQETLGHSGGPLIVCSLTHDAVPPPLCHGAPFNAPGKSPSRTATMAPLGGFTVGGWSPGAQSAHGPRRTWVISPGDIWVVLGPSITPTAEPLHSPQRVDQQRPRLVPSSRNRGVNVGKAALVAPPM